MYRAFAPCTGTQVRLRVAPTRTGRAFDFDFLTIADFTISVHDVNKFRCDLVKGRVNVRFDFRI